MPRYIVLLRTHVWDRDIADMAANIRRHCAGADFVVAADETKGPLSVGDFAKISHTDDFSHLCLPRSPKERVLWWNADYVMHAARQRFPDYDYYVMIEYDTFVTCDVDAMIAHCAGQRIDFVAHATRLIAEDHWSRASVSQMPGPHWWALIPFLVLSGRALDVLLQKRQSMAADLASGRIQRWPYCEPFIPTVIKQTPHFGTATLDMFADTSLLRFRPFVSRRDTRLKKPGIIAHPVLCGQRYIAAALSRLPAGVHAMHEDRLRPEFQFETPEDLAEAFPEPQAAARAGAADIQAPERSAFTGAEVALSDVARDRPARLSSRYKWSKGINADDDAARAVRGDLAEDYAFHTEGEFEPWWCVDLQAECAVERVEIINRRRHARRFTQFRVELSNDAITWSPAFEKADNALVSSDPNAPCVCRLRNGASGRYLRIVLSGSNVLHLRSVKVFGYRP